MKPGVFRFPGGNNLEVSPNTVLLNSVVKVSYLYRGRLLPADGSGMPPLAAYWIDQVSTSYSARFQGLTDNMILSRTCRGLELHQHRVITIVISFQSTFTDILPLTAVWVYSNSSLSVRTSAWSLLWRFGQVSPMPPAS